MNLRVHQIQWSMVRRFSRSDSIILSISELQIFRFRELWIFFFESWRVFWFPSFGCVFSELKSSWFCELQL
jgi:hypothetical protein